MTAFKAGDVVRVMDATYQQHYAGQAEMCEGDTYRVVCVIGLEKQLLELEGRRGLYDTNRFTYADPRLTVAAQATAILDTEPDTDGWWDIPASEFTTVAGDDTSYHSAETLAPFGLEVRVQVRRKP